MKPLRARLPLTCPVFSTQPLSRETALRFECQKDRFTEEQMVAIIRGTDRDPGQAGLERARERPAVRTRHGPRLRVRSLRQWPAAQVPDCDRRVHQEGLAIDVEPHPPSVALVSERSAPTSCQRQRRRSLSKPPLSCIVAPGTALC